MGWDKSKTNPIEWAAKMKDVPREAVNIFAFSIFNRVVMKTPVDTGQARSNWLVSINEEDNNVLGAEVKTSVKKIKRRKGENAGKTEVVRKRSVKLERSGDKTIEQGRMAIAFAHGDDKIIIQNNLPYIRMLEFGGYGKAKGQGQALKGMGLSDEARYQKWLRDHAPEKIARKKRESKITADGHSKQAPRGMVGMTLAKADRIWNAVVKAFKERGGK